jgi:5'-phosphate synthase pdxT subunit
VAARVGILALQGAVRPHAEALADIGAEPVEVRLPRQLDALDALVIPGGESTTMSFLLDSSGLRAPLAAWLRSDRPVLGTCAGMILLASEVLDGRDDQQSFGVIDLSVRRNAFGRQRDSFEADLDVRGIGGPFHAVFIRAPFVVRTGKDVEVLAEVDGHPVLCRSGPVLVSSFHPELGHDRRLHALFLAAVGAGGGRGTTGEGAGDRDGALGAGAETEVRLT